MLVCPVDWAFLHKWAEGVRESKGVTARQFVRAFGLPTTDRFRVHLYPRFRNIPPYASDEIFIKLKEAFTNFDENRVYDFGTTDIEDTASYWYQMNYEQLHNKGVKAMFFEQSDNGILKVICLLEKGATMPELPFTCPLEINIEITSPL
jgi:hypothetical protein